MLSQLLRGMIPLGMICAVLTPGRADEVPYIQSSANVVEAMLSIAQVGPKDLVVDLGSGDGRIVIAAAKAYGARGLGIEYDRQLIEESRANALREGVSDTVSFLHQDIFDADFSNATVVTMYLLPEINLQLRPRILLELLPGTRVVSHDFDMGDWQPERHLVIEVPDKTVGPRKESTVYLWIVPARIGGHWRGTLAGPPGEEPILIEFQQTFQNIQATAWLRHAHLAGSGRIHGHIVTLALRRDAPGAETLHFSLRVAEGRIEGQAVDGGRQYLLRLSRIMN